MVTKYTVYSKLLQALQPESLIAFRAKPSQFILDPVTGRTVDGFSFTEKVFRWILLHCVAIEESSKFRDKMPTNEKYALFNKATSLTKDDALEGHVFTRTTNGLIVACCKEVSDPTKMSVLSRFNRVQNINEVLFNDNSYFFHSALVTPTRFSIRYTCAIDPEYAISYTHDLRFNWALEIRQGINLNNLLAFDMCRRSYCGWDHRDKVNLQNSISHVEKHFISGKLDCKIIHKYPSCEKTIKLFNEIVEQHFVMRPVIELAISKLLGFSDVLQKAISISHTTWLDLITAILSYSYENIENISEQIAIEEDAYDLITDSTLGN